MVASQQSVDVVIDMSFYTTCLWRGNFNDDNDEVSK
jgi:hypothetical protein